MEIIVTLSDTIAAEFLSRVSAANGWIQLAPEQVAERLCAQVRDQLVSQAVSSQRILEQRAAEETIKTMADSGLSIAIK